MNMKTLYSRSVVRCNNMQNLFHQFPPDYLYPDELLGVGNKLHDVVFTSVVWLEGKWQGSFHHLQEQ